MRCRDINGELISEPEDYREYPKNRRFYPVNIHHLDDIYFHNLGAIDKDHDGYRWLNIGRCIDELNRFDKENKNLAMENHVLRKDLRKMFNLLMERGMTYDELHDFLWDCEAAK